MPKGKVLAGIDLGSSKITTIVAQPVGEEFDMDGKLNIVGVSSVTSRGIKKGQIVDIEEAVEAIIESVDGAERMAGYNLDSAFVALGGAHVNSQNSHGVVAVSEPNGEINESDVERVVEAARAVSLPSSREIIHVLPREYIVDGEAGIKDPVGMSGIRLEVKTHLVTASVAAVKNIRKAVNEVGINIDELVYTGYASSQSSLTKTEKELGCAVVDIGGGTTSVAVYEDGALSTSFVLPIGASNVTNDLAIGLRVSLENAEKIKNTLSDEKGGRKDKKSDGSKDEVDLKEIGISDSKKISRKTLTEGIIRPRLNEIFTMIRIQLEREGILSKIPSGVILTGGGAETVGIIDSAKRMMSLPVRIGKPKNIGGLVDDILNPAYSVSVGLIQYGQRSMELEGGGVFKGKLSLPTKGIAGKLFERMKDLLP